MDELFYQIVSCITLLEAGLEIETKVQLLKLNKNRRAKSPYVYESNYFLCRRHRAGCKSRFF